MDIQKLNPDGIEYFKDLLQIFNEVFEHDKPIPRVEYLSMLLHNPDFFVIIAKKNNEVVGGLTVFVLHTSYTEKPVAYIYDVGVKPAFQGKGFGKALLNFLIDYCRQHGFHEAYVEAETDDIDAVQFYRKANFSNEIQATHFTHTFNSK